MAATKYRRIYVDFWEDPKVSECFTPEDKYFYIYLLTNTHTNYSGIYAITKKVMAFDMGYSIETINSLMERFISFHKLIRYNNETRELAIKNWGKFNMNNDGKPMLDCYKSELMSIKDKSLISYVAENIKSEKIKAIFNELSNVTCDDTAKQKGSDTDSIKNKNTDINKCDKQGVLTEREREGVQDIDIDIDINKDIYKDLYSENQSNFSDVENVDNLNNAFSSDETSDKRNLTPLTEIMDLFNSTCFTLPKVKKLSNSRKKSIKNAYIAFGKNLERFKTLFYKTHKSDFLSGRSGAWTGCGFDWILKESNYIKILEGNYDNKGKAPGVKQDSFNGYDQRAYDGSDGRETLADIEKKLLGW
ncbi:hypothetical protein [Clostridium sp. BSD9I1]|uniref:hypothetical protein n=1 Tax=Clostridium sp. BSD9I1 TaxID=2003589 RepID=UPI001647C6FF|nr:hypothetical protein [Clostridium sp. BSD9I1]